MQLTQDPKFMDAIGQLPAFVYETDADIDMAYDWVCEMSNISTFVADKDAWDYFYNMFDNTQED